MRKLLLLFTFTAFVFTSCNLQKTSNDITSNKMRTIKERVVVVKTDSTGSIVSAGRYDDWYHVNTRLTERMFYDVTMEIPRQREKTNIITANLLDFTPGDFVQKDIMARYEMAYHQVKDRK